MNKEHIKNILNDLYRIDESFKLHEKELILIISKIIENKPEINIDDKFLKKLREELVMASSRETIKEKSALVNFGYIFGGVALVSAFVLLILNSDLIGNKTGQVQDIALREGIAVTLSGNAFGKLISKSDTDASLGAKAPGSAERSADMAVGLGGGRAALNQEKMIGIIAPDFVNFNYIYEGDEIASIEDVLPVYRRAASSQSSGLIGSIGDLNLLDLKKFKSLSVENINFSEDREFGFNIYYNLKTNEASLNANYLKWPNPFEGCKDDVCYTENRLKIDDVLSEDEAVKLADKFLVDYGISKESYGSGELDNNWAISYEIEKSEGRDPYIPDYITVIYPLEIEGKKVFDESGGKYGLRVEISNRYKKVNGVYGIKLNQFESSSYETENDVDKLKKLAEQGGIYPSYNYPEAAKQVDVKLGTPEIKLISYWRYDETGGGSEEFYIPALVFPVKERPTEGYFYRENIVIPLVKEILDERLGSNVDRPQIEPMPLLRTPSVEVMASEEPVAAGSDSMVEPNVVEKNDNIKMIK